ncbi:Uma2 family endonuclease [Streptomyces sp. NPDC059452]|uniref:Uma2 family endonuclease n=1 Tax=Streptomyces sp. NPDC059452 TaxID=3346835 RepID=UPI0036B0402E
MSAAPDHELSESYHYPVPPAEGWAAEDLDRLPGLPRRTELIDGSLVFMSPQTRFHMRTMRLLENSLLHQAPDDLDVFREFSIRLDSRNRPEPDVLVVPLGADTGPRGTCLQPEDVILAVEVVSEESKARDRDTKPRKYAAAGVVHFWRVEEGPDGLPVVYVYELDPALKAYTPTGIHHNTLKLDVPFPLSIDLTALNLRRP